MPLPFPLSHHFGTLAGGLGCFPLDDEAYPPPSHSRRPQGGIRSLIGFGTGPPALAHSVLYHRRAASGLHLNAFRGEPAISGFDWHFTSTHNSSHGFSTPMSSGLHAGLAALHPGHGWITRFRVCNVRLPTRVGFPSGNGALLRLGFPAPPGYAPLSSPHAATRRLILQ